MSIHFKEDNKNDSRRNQEIDINKKSKDIWFIMLFWDIDKSTDNRFKNII